MHQVKTHNLTLEIDPDTGHWAYLTAGNNRANWLRNDGIKHSGLPFVAGTGMKRGDSLAMTYESIGPNQLKGLSKRGETHIELSGHADHICASLRLPDRRGPRSGWFLDLNHLDLGGGSIHEQVMPVTIATSDQLDWAYHIWQRSESDFFITLINGPFGAWRIHYSYGGHKMEGFEVLARADDVICPADRFPAGRLPSVTQLNVLISYASSREKAFEKAIGLLGLGALVPSSTGGVLGSSITLKPIGDVKSVELIVPDGNSRALPIASESLLLEQPGNYDIRVTSSNGRMHLTRLHAMEAWRPMAERAVSFHREHYQLRCGAFARILRANSLKPDGRNFGNNHFGDPEEPGSCKTGEFGGFAAWALILHQKVFGKDAVMKESIDRYFNWMLNRGREDNPRPDTVCFTPHNSQGLDYSAYHFFKMICYVQYEAWFIRQLADAVDQGDDSLLNHLSKMCRHFLDDHCDDDGLIWNQNFTEESPVDYSTVDCPLVHLILASKVLQKQGETLGDQLLLFSRKQADHLLQRGFDFPTEGEPCTEDGSIACQAWGLAFAYNQLHDPNPAWIDLATELMEFHAKLEMSGTDARTNGSSLRFWESMYESDNYGPSINAGHAWSIWSAWARWELYLATGQYRHLKQCWNHTIPVANRFDERGACPPCYTPDLIPGVPHDDAWGDPDKKHEGRMTSVSLAWGYPDTLSTSGMHLFIFAPHSWYRACGFDPMSGQCINARFEQGTLYPATPLSCERVALAAVPETPLIIAGLSTGSKVTLTIDGAGGAELDFSGVEDLEKISHNTWQFTVKTMDKQLVTVRAGALG